MRELKFRAWDKTTKKMSPDFVLFGEFLLLGAIHAWQHDEGNEAPTSLESLGDLEIMQFTGLTDKNGKDIYESDILHSCTTVRGEKLLWVVVFHSHFFTARGKQQKQGYYITPKNFWKRCEVVGNIYENPNLM